MGRFVKGQARPAGSGRKPGVGNRVPARIFADVLEQLQARNFSVIDEAVRLYRSRKTNTEMKVRLLSVLSTIAFPRKLAVASRSTVEHILPPSQVAALMANPAIAAHMEALSMAFEAEKTKALPAPQTVTDAEFSDVQRDRPGERL